MKIVGMLRRPKGCAARRNMPTLFFFLVGKTKRCALCKDVCVCAVDVALKEIKNELLYSTNFDLFRLNRTSSFSLFVHARYRGTLPKNCAHCLVPIMMQ